MFICNDKYLAQSGTDTTAGVHVLRGVVGCLFTSWRLWLTEILKAFIVSWTLTSELLSTSQILSGIHSWKFSLIMAKKKINIDEIISDFNLWQLYTMGPYKVIINIWVKFRCNNWSINPFIDWYAIKATNFYN